LASPVTRGEFNTILSAILSCSSRALTSAPLFSIYLTTSFLTKYDAVMGAVLNIPLLNSPTCALTYAPISRSSPTRGLFPSCAARYKGLCLHILLLSNQLAPAATRAISDKPLCIFEMSSSRVSPFAPLSLMLNLPILLKARYSHRAQALLHSKEVT